ncbi:unnamed protein product [Fraxinus pennsylvanica]|uniref:Uncharacterized protein n=1 Tax=Fraxinus pennsylvanica TaxID=56036 RepID=A0AAD1ZHU9_9LAMI|nr:unnamed protein product [Fraxinus pennsylvanica]
MANRQWLQLWTSSLARPGAVSLDLKPVQPLVQWPHSLLTVTSELSSSLRDGSRAKDGLISSTLSPNLSNGLLHGQEQQKILPMLLVNKATLVANSSIRSVWPGKGRRLLVPLACNLHIEGKENECSR